LELGEVGAALLDLVVAFELFRSRVCGGAAVAVMGVEAFELKVKWRVLQGGVSGVAAPLFIHHKVTL
jgi:hypothetical protein